MHPSKHSPPLGQCGANVEQVGRLAGQRWRRAWAGGGAWASFWAASGAKEGPHASSWEGHTLWAACCGSQV